MTAAVIENIRFLGYKFKLTGSPPVEDQVGWGRDNWLLN